MDKIKNQLAGVAALLGVIAAIGGGFVKYGEIVTKLDALEGASGGKDWSAEIAVLEEKVTALENKDLSHSHEVGEHEHNTEGIKSSSYEVTGLLPATSYTFKVRARAKVGYGPPSIAITATTCLLYTSPSPRDKRQSRMPSSA